MQAANPPAASAKAKDWRQAKVNGSGIRRSSPIRTSNDATATLRTISLSRAPPSPPAPAGACAMVAFACVPASRSFKDGAALEFQLSLALSECAQPQRIEPDEA